MHFLGLEVTQTDQCVLLSQQKFTKELLRDCGFNLTRHASTPLPLNCKLLPDEGEPLGNPTMYRALVGRLNFLTHTRPDLSFTIQSLSQFLRSPRTSHLHALIHTLNYIQGTATKGILLKGIDQLTLQAFFDSDCAACPQSGRSVTGEEFIIAIISVSFTVC